MKVSNIDRTHSADSVRGRRSTNLAGSKGMVWRDGATESAGQIRDMTVIGLTFIDNDDGTGVLYIDLVTPVGAGEYDYAEFTGDVNITATTEAGANTIVTGNAVAYDGSEIVVIEFFAPQGFLGGNERELYMVLFDGSTSQGYLSVNWGPQASVTDYRFQVYGKRRFTPTAGTHTYSVRGFTDTGTAQVSGGAGGAGVLVPGFIRISAA